MLTELKTKDTRISMDRVCVIGRDDVPQLIRLQGGEDLNLTFVVLPGTDARLSMEIDLDGPDCRVDIAGVYLCRESEDVAINIVMRHNSGRCESHQLFKGIAGGKAKASFDGLIYVADGAAGTRAFQENHTILLSGEARVEARPQLEIYNDDVECSHGATSGSLNADELFYMRSRGIPEEQALQLQKIAFIAPVLRRLPEELVNEIYENLP